MKTDTNKFESLNNSKELIYDKRLNPTTERPTKSGYYWARYKDKWRRPGATMIEIDKDAVYPEEGECNIMGDESGEMLCDFFRFAGPLEVPKLTIDKTDKEEDMGIST